MADRPYLSYSQLYSYGACSLKYYFQYIEGIKPAWLPPALAFGSAIHASIANYYQSVMEGNPLPLPDFLADFEVEWKKAQEQDIAYKEDDEPSKLLKKAQEMLSEFHQFPRLEGYQLIAIEEPFEISIAPELPPLVGRIDAVYSMEEAPEHILTEEIKTSSSLYSHIQVEKNAQLAAYSLAMAQQGYSIENQSARFLVLVKTKKPQIQSVSAPLSEHLQARFIKTAKMIYQGIQTGTFFPRRDFHCTDCPFRDLCERW